ncbi:MAG: hypothetical protein RLZZ494_1058 [Pseudomonadota bacterium]
MKTLLAVVLAVTVASPALASKELAQQKNCLACHAEATKIVGPAYKDVAAKYKGQKDAVAALATKIQKGGSGVWGTVPMPANAVTDAEAKALATWVLTVK